MKQTKTPNGPAHKVQQLKKGAFIRAFCKVATICHAARIAKIDRRRHYEWLERDEKYAKAFAEAQEIALDVLEREARRRAVKGVREPVGFYRGKPATYVRRYSDVLLIFLLKGANPEKYRDNMTVEHKGKIVSVVKVETIDPYGVRGSKVGVGDNNGKQRKTTVQNEIHEGEQTRR